MLTSGRAGRADPGAGRGEGRPPCVAPKGSHEPASNDVFYHGFRTGAQETTAGTTRRSSGPRKVQRRQREEQQRSGDQRGLAARHRHRLPHHRGARGGHQAQSQPARRLPLAGLTPPLHARVPKDVALHYPVETSPLLCEEGFPPGPLETQDTLREALHDSVWTVLKDSSGRPSTPLPGTGPPQGTLTGSPHQLKPLCSSLLDPLPEVQQLVTGNLVHRATPHPFTTTRRISRDEITLTYRSTSRDHG
ncbi:hypothetical protein GWK47_020192 [Chionoecetes opilio]|uniref:Uncharacterized protein n=1 Tax=Chionoecetes opilio TaxID=41210 RepID=A0A8J5CKY5_CHIOP|nr:hypothetical protein GWK47_020192 [Chionoecetes opilio]